MYRCIVVVQADTYDIRIPLHTLPIYQDDVATSSVAHLRNNLPAIVLHMITAPRDALTLRGLHSSRSSLVAFELVAFELVAIGVWRR